MRDVLDRLDGWAARCRSAQSTLDRHGADRDAVARVAGQVLDLAQDIERAQESAEAADLRGPLVMRDALDRALRGARDAGGAHGTDPDSQDHPWCARGDCAARQEGLRCCLMPGHVHYGKLLDYLSEHLDRAAAAWFPDLQRALEGSAERVDTMRARLEYAFRPGGQETEAFTLQFRFRDLSFTWDPEAEENFRKHGVSFFEAATAFLDPHGLDGVDPDLSREKIVAYSDQ